MSELYQRILGNVPFVLIEIQGIDENEGYNVGVAFGGGLEEKDMEDLILDLANEIDAKRKGLTKIVDGKLVADLEGLVIND